MSKPTYYEMLRDPRWQRKRLEIMKRDEFKCCDCDAADKTLNVHHHFYEKGRAPWEYKDRSLSTLCEDCHKYRHMIGVYLQSIIGRLLPRAVQRVVGYAQGLIRTEGHEEETIDPYVCNKYMARGLSEAIGFDHCKFINKLTNAAVADGKVTEVFIRELEAEMYADWDEQMKQNDAESS